MSLGEGQLYLVSICQPLRTSSSGVQSGISCLTRISFSIIHVWSVEEFHLWGSEASKGLIGACCYGGTEVCVWAELGGGDYVPLDRQGRRGVACITGVE